MSAPVPPTPGSGFVSGYFSGLVDFRFTKYIGPRVLSVIYTLAFFLIVLFAVLFLFAFLSRGSAEAVLGIVVVPIAALLYITFLRLTLELYSAILRTAENTGRAAQMLEAQLAAAGQMRPPGGGYGPPTSGGYEPSPGYGPGQGQGPAPSQGQGPGQPAGQQPGPGYVPPPGGQYPYGPA